LLIGGKAGPRDYIERIKASSSEYILVRAEEIPNAEIPVWLGAMDAAVFAFNSIWVSTSVILAMSYGVPPVVPNMGCLDEYVYDEDTGLIYSPQDPEALAQRILDMQHSPLLDHMRYMCGVMAKKNSVAKIADEYGKLYRAAMAG
jgi:glycosyltransferase involved in cell wall biosynthesis